MVASLQWNMPHSRVLSGGILLVAVHWECIYHVLCYSVIIHPVEQSKEFFKREGPQYINPCNQAIVYLPDHTAARKLQEQIFQRFLIIRFEYKVEIRIV